MDKFCRMPFETVAISSYGHLVPCCAFGMQDPLFNYIENPITIKEYFKSSELKNVQDKFLAGNIPKGCNGCIKSETQSGMSKRQKYLSRKDLPIFKKDRTFPIYVEVAVSNRCNVACVMCNSLFSSGWRVHDREMTGDFAYRKDFAETSFIIEDSFFNELIEIMVNDKNVIVELIGGEPLFNKSVKKFIKKAADMKLSNPISIVTNGTLCSDELVEDMSRHGNITLVLSIDAIGPLYDYIRDYDFSIVERNVRKILNEGIYVIFSPVFSLFNIFHYPQLIKWFDSMLNEASYPIKVHNHIELMNPVIFPPYVSFRNIPKYMLSNVIVELEQLDSKRVKDELDEFVETLKEYEEESYKTQKQSIEWIKKCNKIRGVNIEEIEPRVNEYVKFIEG